jgi:hypothetical protein
VRGGEVTPTPPEKASPIPLKYTLILKLLKLISHYKGFSQNREAHCILKVLGPGAKYLNIFENEIFTKFL